jgi:hypothetical protein
MMQGNTADPQPSSEKPVTTLEQFYSLMARTVDIRRRLVSAVLSDTSPADEDIQSLKAAHAALAAIPGAPDAASVELDADQQIALSLVYEIGELEKDIVYLTRGEAALYDLFATKHRDFEAGVREGLSIFGTIPLRTFISDRDGTVNNYCARYLSSVQSVYNAVFLTRFARACVEKAIILTSAPLANGGLVDIATTPGDSFIYAGSKGREFIDSAGNRDALEVPPEQQAKLQQLNDRLAALLKDPEYVKFGLIGSGFQQKFGQTTVSRQDINGAIPEKRSKAFLETVSGLVRELDPSEEFFRIEDTGLDIEIMLTVKDAAGASALKDFDKGDGVAFLDERLGLELSNGPNLICGDTPSDVPMVTTAVSRSRETIAAFVTRKPQLAEKVRAAAPRAFVTTEPDILVTVLHEKARKEAGRGRDQAR